VVFTIDSLNFGPNLRIVCLQAPDEVIIEVLQRKD
jgi:hypothetical protein